MKLFYLTLSILSSLSFAIAHISTDDAEARPSLQEHSLDLGIEPLNNQPPLSEIPHQDATHPSEGAKKSQFSEKDFLEALLMPASYIK